MIYYTKYAEQKFDVLNKYRLFFTKERVEDVLGAPDKEGKKGEYLCAEKDGLKVFYTKHAGTVKVATFYPVK